MPRFLSKYRLLVLGLAVLVAAEAWYYFSLIKSEKSNNSNSQNKSTASDSIQLSPMRSSLNYLRILNQDVVSSSILANQYLGEVLNVNNQGGAMAGSNFNYQMSISIKGSDNGLNTFFYTSDDLVKMKVTRSVNGKEIPAKLEDIKVSEKIIIKEVLDLTKQFPANRQELTIAIQ